MRMRISVSHPLVYPVSVFRDGSDFVLDCRDVPEAVFSGDTEDEAWAEAVNVIALALLSYPRMNSPFPVPSQPRLGERMIAMPATETAKLLIHQAMAARGMGAEDLARLIDTDHKSVRRILSLAHNTRMDQLEHVLAALDVRVVLMAA
jgi:antitoxin HicB